MNEIVERDPVCGMMVDPGEEAARLEHGGKTYLFCAEACCDKFAKDPAKYLGPEASQPGRRTG